MIDRHKGNYSFFGPAFPEMGWVPAPRYLMRRHLILSHLATQPPGHILEIGCGIGALIYELARSGWQCTGVETSPKAYQLAKSATAGVQNITIVHSLPARLGHFDYLMAFEVLEHIEDDSSELSGWVKYLKPGGMALLSVPAHQWRWSASDVLAGHFRRYSLREFKLLVERCGCDVSSIECYGWPLSNVITRVRAVRDNLRLKRSGGAQVTTAQRMSYTFDSGVDRQSEARLFSFYANMAGAAVLGFSLWLQRFTLAAEMGNGYLLVATRRVPTVSMDLSLYDADTSEPNAEQFSV